MRWCRGNVGGALQVLVVKNPLTYLVINRVNLGNYKQISNGVGRRLSWKKSMKVICGR